jgi:hypothetical protein
MWMSYFRNLCFLPLRSRRPEFGSSPADHRAVFVQLSRTGRTPIYIALRVPVPKDPSGILFLQMLRRAFFEGVKG